MTKSTVKLAGLFKNMNAFNLHIYTMFDSSLRISISSYQNTRIIHKDAHYTQYVIHFLIISSVSSANGDLGKRHIIPLCSLSSC